MAQHVLCGCGSDWVSSGNRPLHHSDVIMSAMVSKITGVSFVCPTIYWGSYQRKHQSSASLVFVMGIHRSPAASLPKGPVTRKMFSFDDVIMTQCNAETVVNIYRLLYAAWRKVIDQSYSIAPRKRKCHGDNYPSPTEISLCNTLLQVVVSYWDYLSILLMLSCSIHIFVCAISSYSEYNWQYPDTLIAPC